MIVIHFIVCLIITSLGVALPILANYVNRSGLSCAKISHYESGFNCKSYKILYRHKLQYMATPFVLLELLAFAFLLLTSL